MTTLAEVRRRADDRLPSELGERACIWDREARLFPGIELPGNPSRQSKEIVILGLWDQTGALQTSGRSTTAA